MSYPGAEAIVPLAFALIIGTVVWQGLTAPAVAQALGVAEPEPTGILLVGGDLPTRTLGEKLHKAGFRIIVADSSWDNVRAARMAGLGTYFGNPVSEHAERFLDLTGIGHMFAMSRRDTLNALACLHFTPEFGRTAVYALATSADEAAADKHRPSQQEYATLFGSDMSYAALSRAMRDGAELRQTTLTEEFGYSKLRSENPGMVPLLAWDDAKRLDVNVGAVDFAPGPGWTVLWLVRPAPAETNGA